MFCTWLALYYTRVAGVAYDILFVRRICIIATLKGMKATKFIDQIDKFPPGGSYYCLNGAIFFFMCLRVCGKGAEREREDTDTDTNVH